MQTLASPPALPSPAEPLTPWQIFFDPRGRIDRRSFWLYGVLALIALGALGHVLLGIARVRREVAEHIVNVLLMWPAIAVSAKRWHDRDKAGWWVLIVFVPVVGWLWALVENGFFRGTPGPNRYGQPQPGAQ